MKVKVEQKRLLSERFVYQQYLHVAVFKLHLNKLILTVGDYCGT